METETNQEVFCEYQTDLFKKELEKELDFYTKLRKKSKKKIKFVSFFAVSLGSVSTAFALAAFATSLTGFGVVVGAPMAGIATVSGFAATGFSVFYKKIHKKAEKNTKMRSLALSKLDTLKNLKKGCPEKNFSEIKREIEKYRNIKTFLNRKTRSDKEIKKRAIEELLEELENRDKPAQQK